MNETVLNKLERRLGGLHARQRLGIETDHEAQIFGQGINFFHIENWYSSHAVIRTTLKLLGLYRRGLKNAEQIQVRHNHVRSKMLPNQFDGFTLLHISDLHADISQGAMRRLNEILPDLTYDMCVLTGDYRGATFGPFDAALEGLARARAHHYRVDNIEKAASDIPDDGFSILLSHTPEVYRQAAHAGFDLFLSGHTHGGQICLPGSIPVTLSSVLPRHMGSGPWHYGDMIVTPRSVWDVLQSPFALIVFPKLPCITSNASDRAATTNVWPDQHKV